jgi:NAD(P)H-dependent FMN reductase
MGGHRSVGIISHEVSQAATLYKARRGDASVALLRRPAALSNAGGAMPSPLDILVLAGSPRRRSYTRGLARQIGDVLRRDGARVNLIDLYDTPLPPLDPDLRASHRRHPDAGVAELLRRAAAADAYVLASPTYHNSYAGVLKNALDYLSIHDFRYRPVGLAAHGGRSTQAVDHLRQVVRGVLGVSIPTQVCTRVSDYAEEPGSSGYYEVMDKEILDRIERFANELLLFAQHLRGLRTDPAAGVEA